MPFAVQEACEFGDLGNAVDSFFSDFIFDFAKLVSGIRELSPIFSHWEKIGCIFNIWGEDWIYKEAVLWSQHRLFEVGKEQRYKLLCFCGDGIDVYNQCVFRTDIYTSFFQL